MSEVVRSTAHIIAAAQLQNIRLVEIQAKNQIGFGEVVSELTVSTRHRATMLAREESSFRVLASLEVRAHREKQTRIRVSVDLELSYELPQGTEKDPAELEAFANVNGVFNAWPYWREIIQNISTRMGLPPLVLPLFRMPSAKTTAEVTKDSKKSMTGRKRVH